LILRDHGFFAQLTGKAIVSMKSTTWSGLGEYLTALAKAILAATAYRFSWG
jgi:hypothetical protein